jgi:biopolymer transport protein ExbD
MNFRRSRKELQLIRMPLAALIDVVLFMLMYFIMAGTLLPAEGELPAALSAERAGAGRGSAFSSQVVRVEQNASGQAVFRLGARVIADRRELVEVLRALPKEPGVVVQAADSVEVQHAQAALQAARDAGFMRVSYVAGK